MASITGTPAVYTDAGASLSDSHTASAAGVELFLCAAERGTTGTSPSVLTYGGVNALATTGGPITALIGTASGQRVHRWYHIPRANHPGTGTHAIACTWAGVDNIAIAVIEVSATGTVTIPSSNQAASGTVAITAGSGDLTIGCAQGNSATPAFAPVNGQTEYLESVWFASSGHVVGVQTGAQTAASWTGAGSICASAFVVHEESAGGDVTVGLTGAAITGTAAAGSLAPSGSVALSGAAVTGALAAGDAVPSVSVGLAGAALGLTLDAGSLAPSLSLALSGSEATSELSAGTLVPSASVALSGANLGAAIEAGTMSPSLTLGLSGAALEAALAAGTVSYIEGETGDVTLALTGAGIGADLAAGDLSTSRSVALSGATGAGAISAGLVSPSLSVGVTGDALAAAVSAGSLAPGISLALMTAAMGGALDAGTLVPSTTRALTSATLTLTLAAGTMASDGGTVTDPPEPPTPTGPWTDTQSPPVASGAWTDTQSPPVALAWNELEEAEAA